MALKNLRTFLLSSLLSFCAMFQFSYINAYPNTSIEGFTDFVNESYQNRYNVTLDSKTFSWIWSGIINVFFIGLIIGTLVTPIVVERFGRKGGLFIASSLNIIGTIVSVVSLYLDLPELLASGRLIAGAGIALDSMCLTFMLQECSPTKIRGMISTFQPLSITISTIVGMVLGLTFVLGQKLVILVAIAAIPDIMLIITMLFCPDTPKHILLIQNDEVGAKKSLKFYYGAEANVDEALDNIKKEAAEDSSQATFKEIWSEPHLRKATIIGIVSLMATVFTGIYAISYFSTSFLEDAGLSKSVAGLGSAVIFAIGLLGVLVVIFKVDSYGRRPLMLIFEVVTVVAVAVFATSNIIYSADGASWAKYVSLAAMLVFSATFVIGPGTIPLFLTSELVPQHCRSLAQSISFFFQTIVSLVVTFLALPLEEAIGGYSFYILFTIPSILCTIYLYRNMPETKNKEIAQIVAEMKSTKSKKTVMPTTRF